MGQSLQIADFTVTKSNPSGSIVRFTITDTTNLLSSTKMQRAVQFDALAQFITSEGDDLITNGDPDLQTNMYKTAGEATRSFTDPAIAFDFDNKRMDVTLTATTNISTSGTITASAPYEDV